MLDKYSDQELQAELERRQKIANAPPKKLDQINWKPIEDMVVSHITNLTEAAPDEDFPHYIFEAEIEAVYGNSIWEWYRKHQ